MRLLAWRQPQSQVDAADVRKRFAAFGAELQKGTLKMNTDNNGWGSPQIPGINEADKEVGRLDSAGLPFEMPPASAVDAEPVDPGVRGAVPGANTTSVPDGRPKNDGSGSIAATAAKEADNQGADSDGGSNNRRKEMIPPSRAASALPEAKGPSQPTGLSEKVAKSKDINQLKYNGALNMAMSALDSSSVEAFLQHFDDLSNLLYMPVGISEEERHYRVISAIHVILAQQPRDAFERILTIHILSIDAALKISPAIKSNISLENGPDYNECDERNERRRSRLYQDLDKLVARFDKHRRPR